VTKVQYALWLAEQAGGAAFYFWPISLGVVAAFVAAQLGVAAEFRSRRVRVLTWVLCLFAVPILGLGAASVFSVPAGSYPGSAAGETVLNMIALVALGAAAVIVALSGRGFRLRATGMVLLPLWLSACALLVGGMAVSGDWL